MNTIAAYAQSPREMVAISSVATMPTDIDAARSLFFQRPDIGDRTQHGADNGGDRDRDRRRPREARSGFGG